MKGTVSAVSTALRSALRGLFPLWGRQPLIARRLRAISRSPANWIRYSRGVAPYGTISAKTFRPGCFKSFSTVRPTRLPAAMRRICWFRLSTTLRRWMPSGRLSTCVWTSWRKRVPCRTASAARFSFPPESSGRPGDGTAFSAPHCVIVANAKNATCVEQDPLIYLSYFELMAQARGIGTLWCGLLYWCLRDVLPDFLPRLGIPDTHQLGYAMLFGYPSINYRRTVETRSALVRHIGWN